MAYSNFKFEEDYYYPESLGLAGAPGYKSRRKEYQRLYSVAKKRLQRFESSGLTIALAYQLNKGLKPASELNDQQIAYELAAVYRMLKSEQGSVSGYRKKMAESIDRLHEKGIDFVNMKNFPDYIAFMEAWRTSELNGSYASEQASESFGAAVDAGADPKKLARNFQFWIEERESVAKLPRADSEGVNAKAIKELKKQHKDKVEKRMVEAIGKQAVRWGINSIDLDTPYFRKNLKTLEKMDVVYGKTARQLKNDIATGKRRKTIEKNNRKNAKKKR